MTYPSGDQMLKDAEWMSQPANDRVLEVIRDEGNMTPLALSRDGEVPRIDIGRKWAGQRCRKLVEYGLLHRIDKGLFGITEKGIAYLEEELDANTLLDPAEES
jgi:hypothetical protein